jgi:serine/threonine protein kinase
LIDAWGGTAAPNGATPRLFEAKAEAWVDKSAKARCMRYSYIGAGFLLDRLPCVRDTQKVVPMGELERRDEHAVLGKYELMQELAVGGMARLYVARARGLADFSKPVALKRILPQYAADPTFVAMFLDEARLAATLHHPNIAQVYDIGQLEGEYFFTMEFVHGESLSRIMQQLTDDDRRLPLEHAVAIGIGVAGGLHYAHSKLDEQGQPMHIVHRDVAPSNILVSYNGGIKLVDFGIAKANTRHHSTEVGTLKGRVAYMSPEQSVGAEIDARSDIFSIGVVLYEVVTGTRMYGGANQLAILHKLLNFQVDPPSALNPECPPELERIIMRALRPNAGERYQTAAELQLDLETFAHSAGLFLSSVRLSKFMRVLFGDRPEPWAEETAMTQIQTTGRAELLDQLEESKPHSAPNIPMPEPPAAPDPEGKRGLGLVFAMILALLAGAGALLFYTGAINLGSASEARPAAVPAQAPASAPVTESDQDEPEAAADQPGDEETDETGADDQETTQKQDPITLDEPAASDPADNGTEAKTDDGPKAVEGKTAKGKAGKTDKGKLSKGRTGKGKAGKGKTGKGKAGKGKAGQEGGESGDSKNPYDAYELPGE